MGKNNSATQKGEKNTSKNKVLNTIVNVVLILAILLGIFCSFTAFIAKSGSGVPSFFGIRPFSIQTESMEPFFSSSSTMNFACSIGTFSAPGSLHAITEM